MVQQVKDLALSLLWLRSLLVARFWFLAPELSHTTVGVAKKKKARL